MDNKGREIKMGILIVLFTFCVITTGVMVYLLSGNTIYNGVSINNIDVGKLTKQDARALLESNLADYMNDRQINLSYKDKLWTIKGSELGCRYDYDEGISKAYNIAREGTPFNRIQVILKLYKDKKNIILKPTYNKDNLEEILKRIETEVNKEGIDAKLYRENAKFIIKEESLSVSLNKEETEKKIKSAIENSEDNISVNLVIRALKPRITKEDLIKITDLLGSYSTRFNLANRSRSNNVKSAAKAIDGVVLMPGDEFSFNDIVGPRTIERGYEAAHVIFKGELIEGVGGGICQVSSTLYNAILASNLEILERHNHSIPSSYIGKGRDATVSYSSLDFKFKNNLTFPIYIESYVYGSKIICRAYGKKIDDTIIKIVTHLDKVEKMPIEIKEDNTMLVGSEKVEKKGRKGYKVSTYRITYRNGKIVEKEKISYDYYRPATEVIIKGTKPVPIKNNPSIEENVNIQNQLNNTLNTDMKPIDIPVNELTQN